MLKLFAALLATRT